LNTQLSCYQPFCSFNWNKSELLRVWLIQNLNNHLFHNSVFMGSISPKYLQADFTSADPKSAKRHSSHQWLFMLLGSMSVKAACKMLIKLTPCRQGKCKIKSFFVLSQAIKRLCLNFTASTFFFADSFESFQSFGGPKKLKQYIRNSTITRPVFR